MRGGDVHDVDAVVRQKVLDRAVGTLDAELVGKGLRPLGGPRADGAEPGVGKKPELGGHLP
jgi:hypothetical protein